MHVLLGYDGSGSADVAATFVNGVSWPAATIVHVTYAIESESTDAEAVRARAGHLLPVIKHVEFAATHGSPVDVITRQAAEVHADLIVVGDSDRGPYATLLGSTSAEMVDRAPCPVLVTRRPSLGSVLLAVDETPPSELALAAVAEWQMFELPRIQVLSVADPIRAPRGNIAAGVYSDRIDSADLSATATEEHHQGIVRRAARRLMDAGRDASPVVRIGNPASQIIEAAREEQVDLVVLGSRGHTGVARAVLGSVAREVLLASEASVLVFRDPFGT